jgi:hypothetical protein
VVEAICMWDSALASVVSGSASVLLTLTLQVVETLNSRCFDQGSWGAHFACDSMCRSSCVSNCSVAHCEKHTQSLLPYTGLQSINAVA